MKDLLIYYYNINVDNLNENEGICSFFYNNNSFYFVPVININTKIMILTKLTQELKSRGFAYHKIIKNRFNNYTSQVGDYEYVLFQLLVNPNYNIDITTLVVNTKSLIVNKKQYSLKRWKELWQGKIDYMEKQISLFGKGKDAIIKSFSYYVGLAENAIIYFENIGLKREDMVAAIQHRRIYCPNIWLNYGNPLSIVIDLPERDIAEYIKYYFFFGNITDAYNDFNYLLNVKKFNKKNWELFFSRLLFPTYYFDLFEKLIIDEDSQDKLMQIIDKVDVYEQFLRYCYLKVSDKHMINVIPLWLL